MAWKPGESGNPSGKQINKPFHAAVERAIKQDDSKRLRQCAEKLLDRAAEGEPWAVALLADRLDGKPHQSIDASVSGEVHIHATPHDESL